MCVSDALLRNPAFPTTLDSSMKEKDLYFPCVQEEMQPVKLPGGQSLYSLIKASGESNFIKTVKIENDSDTKDIF